MATDPDPIQESLIRAEREHADRKGERRFLLGFLLPVILLIILTGVIVMLALRSTPQPMP